MDHRAQGEVAPGPIALPTVNSELPLSHMWFMLPMGESKGAANTAPRPSVAGMDTESGQKRRAGPGPQQPFRRLRTGPGRPAPTYADGTRRKERMATYRTGLAGLVALVALVALVELA
jgi:hypothetical protein